MKRFMLLFAGAFLFAVSGFSPAVGQGDARPPTPQPTDQAGSNTFVRLQDAMQKIRAARFSDYEGRVGVNVESAKAFEEMQNYLLERYEGVEAVNSFMQDNGYVDCIKVESQPSVRQQGIREIAKPPAPSQGEGGLRRSEPGQNHHADSPLKLGLKDRFGNTLSCREGTIPMQRITLDTLVRYRTLRDFYLKVPRGQGVPMPRKGEPRPDWESTHLHAYGYQYVTNYGGNSWLNLWNPSGDFSLSQQWYIGGSGGNVQTVEGGWQICPPCGTNKSVLFIYWTADDYQTTGCYNLDCSGFVQTNSNWKLGGTFDNYSSTGGEQWGFGLQWKLVSGNWWLFLQGSGDFEAVGYYPTSIYKGGQLATNSTLIEYGGEVARETGDVWPQMGSGALADAGYQFAAYQNTIFYILNNGTSVWAGLSTGDEALPSCYTIDYVSASSGSTWGTYFFFGGPGALTCN